MPSLSSDDGWTAEKQMEADHMGFEKLQIAKEKATKYTTEDYFKDLLEIKEKFGNRSLGSSWIMQLQALSMQNSTWEEIDRTAKKYSPNFRTPLSQEQEQEGKETVKNFFTIKSLIHAYLFFLPFVFCLFLIWLFEKTNKTKEMFKNPLSFSISVIFYPIIFSYLIISRIGDAQREIEIQIDIKRRKEKIFSLLSKDEMDFVSTFAKSKIPLQQLRKIISEKSHVSYKHAYGTILCSVIIMLFVPKFAFSVGDDVFVQKTKTIVVSEVISISAHAPPGVSNTGDSAIAAFLSYNWLLTLVVVEKIRKALPMKIMRGFRKRLEHIPLMENWSSINLINQFKIKIRNKKIEKYKFCHIRSCFYSIFVCCGSTN
jgi:hypothetical protein